MVATPRHDIHRMRRAALNPYFSKASIRKLETIVRERVSTLLKRFERHRATGEVVSLSIVFRALTSDIINQYAFGRSGDYLSLEDYFAPFYESVMAFFNGFHLSLYFPWLGPLLDSLPTEFTSKLTPALNVLNQMRKVRSLLSSRYTR